MYGTVSLADLQREMLAWYTVLFQYCINVSWLVARFMLRERFYSSYVDLINALLEAVSMLHKFNTCRVFF